MQKQEAKIQRLWSRYLRERWGEEEWQTEVGADGVRRTQNAVFELKAVKGEILRARDFRPQQLPALCMAMGKCRKKCCVEIGGKKRIENGNGEKESGLVYKLSDTALGLKPFDCFYLGSVNAYVVVAWEVRAEKGWDGWVSVYCAWSVARKIDAGEVLGSKMTTGMLGKIKLK